jgi:glycosyltransferase involved in cell wall biosynthesis
MKIMHVLFYPGQGGSEQYIYLLSKYAIRDGHDIEFVFGRKGPFLDKIKDLGCPTHFIEMKSPFDMVAIFKIRRLFKESRPDIVHTHFLREMFLCAFSAVFTRIKVVQTVHRIEPKSIIQKLFNKIVSLGLNQFIAVSAIVKRYLEKEWIGEKKIMVVGNGAEVNDFQKKEVFPEFNLAEKDHYIVNVGRLSKEKGQKILVDGFLKSTLGKAYNLIVVGDGVDRREIQKVSDEDNVKIIGGIKDGYRLIGISDLYVQPSLVETFSISVIEAMLLGVPVIASDIEAHQILLKGGEYGTLFKSGDSGDLAKKIDKVLGDLDKYKKKAVEAKKFAEKNYTAEIMWKNTKKVYLEVINDKK